MKMSSFTKKFNIAMLGVMAVGIVIVVVAKCIS